MSQQFLEIGNIAQIIVIKFVQGINKFIESN